MSRFGILSCAFIGAFALVAPLNGQVTTPLRANVPFSFHVGNQEMPAGEYDIIRTRELNRSSIAFSQRDVQQGTIFMRPVKTALTMSVAFLSKHDPNQPAKLVFNKYNGDRYFLSQVWPAGATNGMQFAKSRKEREVITSILVTQSTPEQVVIVAQLAK